MLLFLSHSVLAEGWAVGVGWNSQGSLIGLEPLQVIGTGILCGEKFTKSKCLTTKD